MFLERELEDHEFVEEIYTHWARDSNNQFLFRRNDLKYEIFTDPIVSCKHSCNTIVIINNTICYYYT